MGLRNCSEASFLSKLFFWWLNDLLLLGYKRDLKNSDLINQLPKNDASISLGTKLFSLWDAEQSRERPSLFRAIRKEFGIDYILLGFLPFVEECGIRILQAMLLGVFIEKLQSQDTPYIEGCSLILCSILNVFTTHWFYFSVQHVGMRIRIACSCLIYRKCLRQLQSPEGRILNLISSDVQRFDQASVYLHYLWIAPLNLVIAFTILYQYYGPASLVGLLFLLFFTFLQAFLGVSFSKLRSLTAAATDLRLEFMSNMLKKMKQIKMICLEEIYSDKCRNLRRNEMKFIRQATYLRAINLTFFYSSVKIIFLLIIWWYGQFNLEKIFVTITLLNNLRTLMMNNFPNGVLQLAEALVAIKRIQTYLLLPNENKVKASILSDNSYVSFSNVPLKCQEDKLNLIIQTGDIVSIVGSVGTGKTTLLRTIMGEVSLSTHGIIRCEGTVAYVPQVPWIYPASMKDNIILNSAFDSAWYEKVIQACALKDFGHVRLESLSGGMRARIGLARAAYSRASIYLLDDPFSALDTNTKSFIISELILKLLDNKIRIICESEGRLGKIVSIDGKESNRNRKLSISLIEARPDETQMKTENQDEELKRGSVSWRTYFDYFNSGTGIVGFSLLVVTNILCQTSFSGADYYLKIWETNDNYREGLNIYAILILSTFGLSFLRCFLFFRVTLSSAESIHQTIFDKVIRAHQEFLLAYGKVLNRFGKDMSLVDESLPYVFFSATYVLLNVLGTVAIITFVQPHTLIPALFLTVIFYLLRKFYIRTGRAIRRIEALGRTPLYTLISATGAGLSVIRCFNAENKFLDEFYQRLDNHSRSWYINLATSRWFGIYLDWITVLYTSLVVGGFLIGSHVGADVGLAVSSVLFLSAIFQLGARESAMVESQMISVERILEYRRIEVEDFETGFDLQVSAPIVFENVSVTYSDMQVLRNVSLQIQKGEKVALLGRTGCGKSTLLKALYRLADYTGTISFSGNCSKQIKLEKLRSSLSIIPQEPYLFEGTIRDNLDPKAQFTDEYIHRVFNRFQTFFDGIYQTVEEDGKNLSQGQRQILALLRVILKQNDILVMDEPTSNLDFKTRELINQTLEEFCSKCTVLTVAHRLRTVANYDRAFLIQDGELIETTLPDFSTLDEEIAATTA